MENKKKLIPVIVAVVACVIAVVVVLVICLRETKNDDSSKSDAEEETCSEEFKYVRAHLKLALDKKDSGDDDSAQGILLHTAKYYVDNSSMMAEDDIYDTLVSVFYTYADISIDNGKMSEAEDFLSYGDSFLDGLVDNYNNDKFVSHGGKGYVDNEGCVYLGKYPLSKIPQAKLSDAITGAKYDENGIATICGIQIKQEGTSYYLLEPIRWKVLKKSDDTYSLQSYDAIDNIPYNDTLVGVEWNDTTLRAWLNKNFIDIAFDKNVQKSLQDMEVKESNNPDYNKIGGSTVNDKVTILAIEEVVNGANGYDEDRKTASTNRSCLATEYAIARGIFADSNGCCKWILRTRGVELTECCTVGQSGIISCDGELVDSNSNGVRPVILVDKSAIEG